MLQLELKRFVKSSVHSLVLANMNLFWFKSVVAAALAVVISFINVPLIFISLWPQLTCGLSYGSTVISFLEITIRSRLNGIKLPRVASAC